MNTIPCNPLRPIAAAALAAGLAIVPAFILASEPPEKDREAILSMAGEFEVLFNFEETVSLQKGYTLKEPYQEDASELVLVIEDTGDRIVLQHILTTSRGIVKHWKQVWTWEDTRIVEYQGRSQWAVRELDPEEVKGTWSQLVSQVDDSPRYESYAKWRHDGGYSRWESRQTARPLPRREHTKRDDYQILQAVNRHAITPHGWVHEQDNLKQVIDENGDVVRYIAVEQGVNYYDRTDEVDFTEARAYWKATQDFWSEVSAYWSRIEAERSAFGIAKEVEGKSLVRRMFDHAAVIADERGEAPARRELFESISDYLVEREG